MPEKEVLPASNAKRDEQSYGIEDIEIPIEREDMETGDVDQSNIEQFVPVLA